jgi:hypothetical protein
VSIGSKNDDSTYFQEEGRLSYQEESQGMSSAFSDSTPRENVYSSHNESVLPMFSFPPTERYPFSSKGNMMNAFDEDSSYTHFRDQAEFTDLNPKFTGASNQSQFSFDGSVSAPISSDVQSRAETAPKEPKKTDENIEELLNGLVSVPHFKDHRFSTRRDVINKTVFRIMKRYYLQLFKNMFPKMKLKVNTVEEYLEASKQLLSSLSGDVSVNESLKFFII